MKAKTISVNYEPGEFYITQGHKGYERKHRNKLGQTVTPTGFGWGTVSKSSRITVDVNVNGKCREVFVDHFFKDNWGKLTAGRVQAIKETVPDELSLIENTTYSGGTYYTVKEEDMYEWLVAAKKAR